MTKNFGLTIARMASIATEMGKDVSEIRAMVLAVLLQEEMLDRQLGIGI